MQIVRSISEMQRESRSWRLKGRTIGFVPTMGALHDGHASLIRAARRETDQVVVSIFINPIQFNDQRDYRTYPRDLSRDRRLVMASGASLLFVPNAAAFYPDRHVTYVTVERLTERLCGRSRPGHFRGVTTVVAKLLHCVQPDRLYLGQKDAQQAVVLRRMVVDLSWPVVVRVLPTIREAEGLAMSSRNALLTPQQRCEAVAIAESLRMAQGAVRSGEQRAAILRRLIRRRLEREPSIRVDYVEVVDVETLAPLARVTGRAFIAVAAWVGAIRLIDNVIVRIV